jgi:hypothetical protein
MNTDSPTITVLYSCYACSIRDRAVTVQARTALEDVVKWVESAAIACGRDHMQMSPRHFITKLDQLKIPLPAGEQHLGAATTH